LEERSEARMIVAGDDLFKRDAVVQLCFALHCRAMVLRNVARDHKQIDCPETSVLNGIEYRRRQNVMLSEQTDGIAQSAARRQKGKATRRWHELASRNARRQFLKLLLCGTH
jgi:hypothetical protein